MTESLHQPIDYDVRKIWREDREWVARRLVPADAPGLDLIQAVDAIDELTPGPNTVGEPDPQRLSWALESRRRVVGCVCTRVRHVRTPETPQPWSQTTPDALEAAGELPSLSIDRIFWSRRARLKAVEVLRDVVLNAVQLYAFSEASVELPFEPASVDPAEPLMRRHADFRSAEFDADPIALFLRADFYLQGYYRDEPSGYVARLNWPNRAR